MVIFEINYCENCSHKLNKDKKPYTCPNPKCGFIRFENATSVVVTLIPVRDNGVLKFVATRRGIEPKIGQLAFPGGFQEIEQAEFAAAREVEEETGLVIELVSNEALVLTTPDSRRNLIFFIAKEVPMSAIDFNFKNPETLEVLLMQEDTQLAFPLHEKALKWAYSKIQK